MECVECTYLDLSTGDCYGEYFCEKKYERHSPIDPTCGSFTRAYSRSSSEINNAKDFYNSKNSSSCYITTMICHCLCVSDSNYFLNTLRKFRDNYLVNNEEYREVLVEYDIVGPMIAKSIAEDRQNKFIAARMFYNYINPIVSLINDGMYKDAISLYKLMTNILKQLYNIDYKLTNDQIMNSNLKESGHGVYKKIKK